MRDGHRLRERIQLSLDDRQVAALATGALLLLAGMFALGLLVGMQVARRSPEPAPMGDLAALDEQTAQAHRAVPGADAKARAPGPSAQPQAAVVPAPLQATQTTLAPALPSPVQDAQELASAPARIEPALRQLERDSFGQRLNVTDLNRHVHDGVVADTVLFLQQQLVVNTANVAGMLLERGIEPGKVLKTD